MFISRSINREYLIAGNPEVAGGLLKHLARSTDASVRARVAENIATPLSTLMQLVNDEDKEVRLSLSVNKSLPKMLLAKLAKDADPDVRFEIADNAQMPKHLLELLSEDENPYVAHRAQLTLTRLQSLDLTACAVCA